MAAITSFYASILALFLIYLANTVASHRRKDGIGIGGDPTSDLGVRIRAHANAVENVPMTLLLMLFAELNGAPGLALHVAGVLLVASRLMHAHGFTSTKGRYSRGRFVGTAINWGLVFLLAVGNFWLIYVAE